MVSGQQYIEDMERKYMTADAIELICKFKADIPTDEGIQYPRWGMLYTAAEGGGGSDSEDEKRGG